MEDRPGNKGNLKKRFIQRSRLDIRQQRSESLEWPPRLSNVCNSIALFEKKNVNNYWRKQDKVYEYRAELNLST